MELGLMTGRFIQAHMKRGSLLHWGSQPESSDPSEASESEVAARTRPPTGRRIFFFFFGGSLAQRGSGSKRWAFVCPLALLTAALGLRCLCRWPWLAQDSFVFRRLGPLPTELPWVNLRLPFLEGAFSSGSSVIFTGSSPLSSDPLNWSCPASPGSGSLVGAVCSCGSSAGSDPGTGGLRASMPSTGGCQATDLDFSRLRPPTRPPARPRLRMPPAPEAAAASCA
mmetsp:Transcript_79215/g.224009  ORF Transcript_79215/g.224009 Transcript_79215/m.224009 type:complete len:225 (-) Transcript_79215:17-691(-)